MNRSMAELTTGVMVICLPTLPGILHYRKKKPSISIVNGNVKSHNLTSNARYGPRSVGKANTFLGGEYIELGEGQHRGPDASTPRDLVVNEIRGDEDNDRTSHHDWASNDDFVPPGRILKMIKIEQSDT